MDLDWRLFIWPFPCGSKYLKKHLLKFNRLNVKLVLIETKKMRYIIKKNLQVIKKFYSKKSNISEDIDINPIKNEFKEWIDDSFNGSEVIWTLPDLTRTERLENFCRSIKKKIN